MSVAIAALLLVACGSDDEDVEATTTTSTTTVDSATTESTSATTDSTTTESTATELETEPCSAFGLTPPEPQADLPTPVAERRTSIVEDAIACDIDGLVSQTGPAFIASFGGVDPATLWADGEARGEDPLRILVEVLGAEHAVIEGEYVWPAAITDDFAGYRVGIGVDGTWLFFVAGD